MEDFFHRGPPLAGRAGRDRLLARLGRPPPALRRRIGGHTAYVLLVILPVVLEAGEEARPPVAEVLQVDRVVPDVAGADRLEHGGRDGLVQALVLLHLARAETDHHPVALQAPTLPRGACGSRCCGSGPDCRGPGAAAVPCRRSACTSPGRGAP